MFSFSNLFSAVLWTSVGTSFGQAIYQIRYKKVTKKLCMICMAAYSLMGFMDLAAVFFTDESPVRCGILASIEFVCTALWYWSYKHSDDDDDDFKRDLEKVKSKVTVTASGLKVVPQSSS